MAEQRAVVDSRPDGPGGGPDYEPIDVREASRRTDGLYCEHLDRLAHEVISASVACMRSDQAARQKVFRRMLLAYTSVFVLGLVAFAVAVVEGLMDDASTATTAVFAGVSGASFVSMFLFRPLSTLKRNSVALTWLNVVTTSYWTRHYDLNKRGELHRLGESTAETVGHLAALLELQPRPRRARDDDGGGDGRPGGRGGRAAR
ncbi:MAG TPA: hypothetical protein VFO65_10950 [Acidimicrobiales bacterium]|nr:hypothetical protein [Acidimicrobiales bacterium]